MSHLLDLIALLIGLGQLGTVVFLLVGPLRKYGFVFAYCSVQLCTSLTEIVVARKFGIFNKLYHKVFWTDEIILDLLLFFILILLTYRAMEGSAGRGTTGRLLTGVAFIAVLLPFVLFPDAFQKTAWFDHTSQLLNFGAAILNLGLWTALLGSRKRDPQLLAVSAGFGILATGVAVSFGLRRLIQTPGPAYNMAQIVFLLAHLAGALVLCWAFRPSREKLKGRWNRGAGPRSVLGPKGIIRDGISAR